jgi:hypothetical protein
MSETIRVMPGYRHSGETIEVTQQLREPQFRAIETILGLPPQRFKEWAEHFVFTPSTPGIGRRLRAYLRRERLAHTTELLQTFVLEDRPAAAGRRRR